MTKIKLDRRNYRKHNEKNMQLIKKSLEDCGTGRSILIDNNNEIIAGNGVYAQAEKLNIPVKIIETDGNELIAIKRTDLATDDDKRKQLAVMDNTTSDSSSFDFDLLKSDFELVELDDLGVHFAEFDDIDDDIDEQYIDKKESNINKELLQCPHCGHINEKKAFCKYENS